MTDRLAIERWIGEGGRLAPEAVIERERRGHTADAGAPAEHRRASPREERTMSSERRAATQSLLFVSDAAVADVDELPIATTQPPSSWAPGD
jgi:hypothetical protein